MMREIKEENSKASRIQILTDPNGIRITSSKKTLTPQLNKR